ncbi:MAG: FHA domain-containing protein, partial [Cyanobacteria bacterium P01_H01_bin.121]
VPANANFCGHCGIRIKDTVNSSASPFEMLPTAPPGISPQSLPASNPLPASNVVTPLSEEQLASAQTPSAAASTPAMNTSSSRDSASPQSPQSPSRGATLLHIRTNTVIPLQPTQSLFQIGKANDKYPPDIDLSSYPDAEVVSRVHARLRRQGNHYQLEDMGSSNGTFINGAALPRDDYQILQDGDRLSFGKGELVAFIFRFE